MFTWICPTCGREVPPAYDECPDCAAKTKSGAPAGDPAAPAPPAGGPQAAAPPYVPPPAAPRAALPTWLMAILFAVAFVALGGGVLWLVHRPSGGAQASAAGPAASAAAAGTSAGQHPLQKYIEIAGIRFVESAKQDTEARFVVVNHSGADVTDLAGTVNIWGRAGKTEEAAGSFSFKMPSLGPYESKESVAPVVTKLKVYELPDWQFITTEVRITAP